MSTNPPRPSFGAFAGDGFNRTLHFATHLEFEATKPRDSWWTAPMSYSEFSARAQQEHHRIQHGDQPRWKLGERVIE